MEKRTELNHKVSIHTGCKRPAVFDTFSGGKLNERLQTVQIRVRRVSSATRGRLRRIDYKALPPRDAALTSA